MSWAKATGLHTRHDGATVRRVSGDVPRWIVRHADGTSMKLPGDRYFSPKFSTGAEAARWADKTYPAKEPQA